MHRLRQWLFEPASSANLDALLEGLPIDTVAPLLAQAIAARAYSEHSMLLQRALALRQRVRFETGGELLWATPKGATHLMNLRCERLAGPTQQSVGYWLPHLCGRQVQGRLGSVGIRAVLDLITFNRGRLEAANFEPWTGVLTVLVRLSSDGDPVVPCGFRSLCLRFSGVFGMMWSGKPANFPSLYGADSRRMTAVERQALLSANEAIGPWTQWGHQDLPHPVESESLRITRLSMVGALGTASPQTLSILHDGDCQAVFIKRSGEIAILTQ